MIDLDLVPVESIEVPAVMNDTELRRALGLGETQFYALKKRGTFKRFEVKKPIGNRRYSRTLVRLHCDGESTVVMGGRRK